MFFSLSLFLIGTLGLSFEEFYNKILTIAIRYIKDLIFFLLKQISNLYKFNDFLLALTTNNNLFIKNKRLFYIIITLQRFIINVVRLLISYVYSLIFIINYISYKEPKTLNELSLQSIIFISLVCYYFYFY